MTTLGWIVELDDRDLVAGVDGLRERLLELGYGEAAVVDADVVLVWADRPLARGLAQVVTDPDVRVVLAGPTLGAGDPERALAEAAGLYVAGMTRIHDIRMRGPRDGGLSLSGHEHAGGDHVGRHDHVSGCGSLGRRLSPTVVT